MTHTHTQPRQDEAIDNSRFLRACRREPVDATPIWVMRQAGRYMRAYKELRKDYGFYDIIKSPELAATVTMQPIRAFHLDAAIIFSDVLPLLETVGLELTYVPKPTIRNPLRTEADVANLKTPDVDAEMAYTAEAIQRTRQMLDPRGIPLIGFSATPFSLAQYAIEGQSSKKAEGVKTFMMAKPEAWAALMQTLTGAVADYLLLQARAGAHALQLFDAQSGWLSPADYRQHALPYVQQIVARVRTAGVPIIHAVTDGSAMLEDVAAAGSDVVGVDWRIDLDRAWARIGHDRAIQGNLDPGAMLAPWAALKARATQVLDQAAGRSGHIFNLGHGIPRSTREDNMKRLVNFVHEYSSRTIDKATEDG